MLHNGLFGPKHVPRWCKAYLCWCCHDPSQVWHRDPAARALQAGAGHLAGGNCTRRPIPRSASSSRRSGRRCVTVRTILARFGLIIGRASAGLRLRRRPLFFLHRADRASYFHLVFTIFTENLARSGRNRPRNEQLGLG